MKFVVLALLSVLSLMQPAHANSVRGQILALTCMGNDRSGTSTTIAYAGVFAGSPYLNITALTFGMPFSQQAQVRSANYEDGVLELNLMTVITGGDLTLRLYQGSDRGELVGRDGSKIPLNCVSRIQ